MSSLCGTPRPHAPVVGRSPAIVIRTELPTVLTRHPASAT
jgi:hypothetical protein